MRWPRLSEPMDAGESPPARLLAARCRCRCILRGDHCVALVMKSRTLWGLCADLPQLVRSFLDIPAMLCGHHAPEKVRHATVCAVALLSTNLSITSATSFSGSSIRRKPGSRADCNQLQIVDKLLCCAGATVRLSRALRLSP